MTFLKAMNKRGKTNNMRCNFLHNHSDFEDLFLFKSALFFEFSSKKNFKVTDCNI